MPSGLLSGQQHHQSGLFLNCINFIIDIQPETLFLSHFDLTIVPNSPIQQVLSWSAQLPLLPLPGEVGVKFCSVRKRPSNKVIRIGAT